MKNSNFLKTDKEITAWLEQYEIRNYTLVENFEYGYVVNVAGEVNLVAKSLNLIPVKFNKVRGSFSCSDNNLITLDFCPITVGVDFDCSHNKLTSLEFCPTTVAEDFYCHNNQLNTVEFCPTTVVGNFYCHENYALGEIQNTIVFSDVLKAHQEFLIKKEKDSIEKELGKLEDIDIFTNKSVLKI